MFHEWFSTSWQSSFRLLHVSSCSGRKGSMQHKRTMPRGSSLLFLLKFMLDNILRSCSDVCTHQVARRFQHADINNSILLPAQDGATCKVGRLAWRKSPRESSWTWMHANFNESAQQILSHVCWKLSLLLVLLVREGEEPAFQQHWCKWACFIGRSHQTLCDTELRPTIKHRYPRSPRPDSAAVRLTTTLAIWLSFLVSRWTTPL